MVIAEAGWCWLGSGGGGGGGFSNKEGARSMVTESKLLTRIKYNTLAIPKSKTKKIPKQGTERLSRLPIVYKQRRWHPEKTAE